MPQIMIDALAAPPAYLRATAKFLEQMADMAEGKAPTAAAVSSVAEVIQKWAPPASEFPDPTKVFGLPPPAPPMLSIVPPPPGVPSGTVQVPPPPPPPAPSVQTAATPAVPPASSGADPVELDSEGFPYDARIHGTGENRKKKTGEWKYRRGIDAASIQLVEAELRSKGYGVKPTAAPPPPPTQQSFVPPPPPVSLPGGTVGAPPPPPPGSLPAGPAASPVEEFRLLMKKITPHMAPNGKLALTILTPIYARLGVKGLEDFAKPGAPIAQMNAEVDAILGVA